MSEPDANLNSDVHYRYLNLHELVRQAYDNLSANTWDYLIGSSETETTQKRNRLALDKLAFRPRVLRDVNDVDHAATFLGRRLSLPIAVAPVGSLESFDPEGGKAVARACARAGIVSIHSSVSAFTLEEAAAAADNLKIFQLYVRGDDAWVDDIVRRTVEAGYGAFCLTVDTAHYSRRERDIAKRFVKPWRGNVSGLEFLSGLSWDQVKRFKDKHDIPLLLKGIATAEDAGIALEHGVDGIYVSNHGGRQLDHGLGSIDVLPEIVAEVDGRAMTIVDGGVMRGTDIVKAVALGADLVAMGRMPMCGLAAAGEDGLVRVVELLAEEVEIALALLGITAWDQLDAGYLTAGDPVVEPHALSAFPLLDIPAYRY